MRYRVVLLLVLALLFKGWWGAAMAGEMVNHQLSQAVMAAAMQGMHGDECAGHTGASGDTGTQPACEQCQGCTLNALPSPALALADVQPLAPHMHAAVQFASAEPRQDRKPPVF